MHRVWLVIPARGVAIDIEGVLGVPSDAARRQRLVDGARRRYRDLTVRLVSGAASSAYVRLEGSSAEHLAELRGVGLAELKEFANGGAVRTAGPAAGVVLGPPAV